MSGEVLVDTNVLVYAYDRSEPVKQQQAVEVLDTLAANDLVVVSTQILAEFFVTVTWKMSAPLTPSEAYGRMENFLQAGTFLRQQAWLFWKRRAECATISSASGTHRYGHRHISTRSG